ncbi:hypothetical protein Q5X71_02365 [Acinetobacter baumannii]|nr:MULTISPECIES: hypothetical protein [Acinetobacter calcoaceticus/baumannii complex]EHU2109493.1 hypothetical protein [Acinetobacter baumannii]EHZ6771585.1 hypothetical protein [Acinetobacter baumannii]EKU1422671.1 hypothetical protein [Acinetobacter baumannii]EKU3486390.1 hypothetical protein [Acinetobacter baumannii]EKU6393346.1 hypothetical protein [Acinetobacter baumannii]
MLNNMTFFIDDFIEVTEKNNIHFYTLSQEESRHIFRRLFDKFFSNKLSMEKPLEIPLWQFLNKENSIGVHLPNAAGHRELFLNQLPNIKNVYFLFDLEFSNKILKFKFLSDLVIVLEDSYNFNFYIFDESFNFLLSWNKDETLFGSGDAKEFVLKIKESWNL